MLNSQCSEQKLKVKSLEDDLEEKIQEIEILNRDWNL